MILKKFLTNMIKYFPSMNAIKFKTSKKSKYAISLGGSFLDYIRDKIPFLDNTEKKIEKYWHRVSLERVIEEADKSLEEERYMDVYERLNKIKYSKDIEVIWRLARVLFNLSRTSHIAHDVRKQMIEEAYEILETSKETGINQGNYHKWRAVITNRRNGLESLETKIRGYPGIRDQLLLACKSNPQDYTAQYMLGRWHYEMANLTWFQRKIAKYLFQEPPNSTYQEAYKHLYKAEELNPRYFLPNMYMLGCVCMKLGQYYRPNPWTRFAALQLISKAIESDEKDRDLAVSCQHRMQMHESKMKLVATFCGNQRAHPTIPVRKYKFPTHWARYYLNMALNLPTQSKCEECCAANAKNLLDRLEKYHLGLELLFNNLSFVHGFEG